MGRVMPKKPAACLWGTWGALLFLSGTVAALADQQRGPLAQPVGAAPSATIRYVSPAGHDGGSSCVAKASPCATVQRAVDVATPGDEVWIAGGTYTRPGTVAALVKGLRLKGAYDPAFTHADPAQHPTVLDAQGLGSALSIRSAGEVWLERLTLTGGNGAGNCDDRGCGGGIYAADTALHLVDCTLTDNVGSRSGRAEGGGLYAAGGTVEILESRVLSNTANANPTSSERGHGGGIYINQSAVKLVGNQFLDNRAALYAPGFGGGASLNYLIQGEVVSNTFATNQANTYGYYGSYGGGLYIANSAAVTLSGNRFEGNRSNGTGGGVEIIWSDVIMARNLVLGNLAAGGGGVFVQSSTPVTLNNNLVAGNQAGFHGGGVYASLTEPPGSRVLLVNNTIADNGAEGIASWSYAVYTLTNNIIAGHDTGIVTPKPLSATITADTNLFWNGNDPIVGGGAIRLDPRLRPDYRLRTGSPAVDAGLIIPWLTVDLDGEPRPQGGGYDLGAYEGEEEAWDNLLPLVWRHDSHVGR